MKQIIQAAQEFEKTGTIPKDLFVCFDQTGHWLAGSLWDSEETELRKNILPQTYQKLKVSHINKELLSQVLEDGSIELFSSLNIENTQEKDTHKKYSRVLGSVLAASEKIELPNLQYVGRQLSLFGPHQVELPVLREIGQCLITSEVKSLLAPKLTKIGWLAQLDKIKVVNFPSLREIGSELFAPVIETLELPELEEIGGHTHLTRVQNLNAPKLKEVHGKLNLEYTQKCLLPELLRVQSLQSHSDLLHLPKLEKIEENLRLLTNHKIFLPSLKEIGQELFAPDAREIDLPKLKKIGGSLTATKAQNIKVPSLKILGRGFRSSASNLFGSNKIAITSVIKQINQKELERILSQEDTGYLHNIIKEELNKRIIIKGKLKTPLELIE